MRGRYLIGAILVFVLLGIWGVNEARAQTEPPHDPGAPEVEMPPLPQGLDPPPTVYPPTEISKGSNVYYLVCMACHGDKGQGLTDEWRGALDEPDQNCWQSKCHHSNHPPGGFVFPKFVPAVTGPIMPARFKTGLELHNYIKTEMPFQAPGSLKDEEYWQLTAFLLALNGVDPGNGPLNEVRAAAIYLSGPPPQPAPAHEAAPVEQAAASNAERAEAGRDWGRRGAVGLILAAVSMVVIVWFWPFKQPITK